VVEVKLRHSKNAECELRTLYSPLVEHVFGLPQVLLEICKIWTRDEREPVKRLMDVLGKAAIPPPFHAWHWLG
jgi:hypothetical protein